MRYACGVDSSTIERKFRAGASFPSALNDLTGSAEREALDLAGTNGFTCAF
jgi:hypothetical protein